VDYLKTSEVKKAIHFGRPERPPMACHKWVEADTQKCYGRRLEEILATLPDDTIEVGYESPGWWEPKPGYPSEYRWSHRERRGGPGATRGLDSADPPILSPDDYEPFIQHLPDPQTPGTFDKVKQVRDENPDRYVLGSWWGGFFEMSWACRGMTDILMDFLLYPDLVHKFLQALADYQVVLIQQFAEAGVDGIWTTDDLGSQESLIMSPEVFRSFIKPRYAQVIAECHKYGLDFWLHSCGNIGEIIGDFVEIGLDVLHPLQPGAVDEKIVESFVGKICLIPAIDVQHLLPEGTPDQVRWEIRRRLDRFYRPEGGMMIGVANSVMPETPLENIQAYVDEVLRYCENLAYGRG